MTGPEDGTWDIVGAEITYHCDGDEPYSLTLGEVELGDHDDLNLWYAKPPKVFDV